QAVGLGLIVGHDHEGHGLGLREDRAAVQPHVAPAGQGELDHQFGAFRIGGIVSRAGDDALDAAVRQTQRDIELGRLLRLSQIVPDTGNDLVAHDASAYGVNHSAARSVQARRTVSGEALRKRLTLSSRSALMAQPPPTWEAKPSGPWAAAS